MKVKCFFILAVILLSSSSCLSQVIERKVNDHQASIYIKGGCNLATLVGKGTDDFEINKGLLLGLSRSGQMNRLFNSQIELIYTMKGTSFVYKDEFDKKTDINLELHYIELPLIIKYKLRKRNQEKITPDIFFNFGCSMGFNIKAEYDTELDQDILSDASNEINNREFCALLGASFESKLKNQKKYSLEFRYSRSLMSIWENDDYENFNEVFSFIIGIGIFDF